MSAKLTPAHVALLKHLGTFDEIDVPDKGIMRALERRGLVEQDVLRCGNLAFRHVWRLTERGRVVANGRPENG